MTEFDVGLLRLVAFQQDLNRLSGKRKTTNGSQKIERGGEARDYKLKIPSHCLLFSLPGKGIALGVAKSIDCS
jgi:hypothetical protein